MGFRIRRGEERDGRAIGQGQVESWTRTYAGIDPDDFLVSMDADSRADRWSELIAHIYVAEDEIGVFGFAVESSRRAFRDLSMPEKSRKRHGTTLV
jgi:hypothetical protein